MVALLPVFSGVSLRFKLLLLNQGALYIISFVGMTLFICLPSLLRAYGSLDRHIGLLTVPYYFVLANSVAAVALPKSHGDSSRVWEPVRNTVLE